MSPALPFLVGALALPLLPRGLRPWASLLPPLAALALLAALQPGTVFSLPFLGVDLVPLRVDRLALGFGWVFTLFAFLAGVYALHLRDTGQQVAALLYAGSALGVVFAGDLFTLLVFWEGMALSSVWLIWARGTRRAREAGTRYLFVHLTGGALLLGGVLLHYGERGSLAFEPFSGGVGAVLVLLAFAINAAIPPLHAWLPDAYPEGTVTGSVFLSAFTTKAAVYTLARGFPGWEVLLWAGAAMAIYGVVYVMVEDDIRRVLSFHIVSQVGYMVAGVGLGGEWGVNGGTGHAFTNILYKGLLFMATGAVLHATGWSSMSRLGGLWRALRTPLLLYLVGALAISGVPPFSGFVSKTLLLHAAEKAHQGLVVLLLNLAAVGTFLSLTLKLPFLTWFGPRGSAGPLRPIPWNMTAAMALTALLNIVLGVYPPLLYALLPHPIAFQPYTAAKVTDTLLLLLFTGLGFLFLLPKVKSEPAVTLDTDWFYRHPGRVLAGWVVLAPNRLFGQVEGLTLRLVRLLGRAAADPVGFLLAGGRGPTGPYDPDRYRSPVGVMALVVVAAFVALISWLLVHL
jgi:multicomponent Na+:H+ antiporter subunit D